MEGSTDFNNIDNVTYTGSLVSAGGNITFNARNNMNQIGSEVSSGGNITYNVAENLRLEASRNKYTTESGSKSASASIGFGNNSVSVSANMSQSSSRGSNISYNYSSTYADEGSISYNVGGNMIGMGYNAIGKHVNADVKGGRVPGTVDEFRGQYT